MPLKRPPAPWLERFLAGEGPNSGSCCAGLMGDRIKDSAQGQKNWRHQAAWLALACEAADMNALRRGDGRAWSMPTPLSQHLHRLPCGYPSAAKRLSGALPRRRSLGDPLPEQPCRRRHPHGLTVLTNKRRHFELIAKLKIVFV